MPLTEKGEEIKHNMEKEYGKEHGERVFYASKNAGTISGVDSVPVAGCYGRDQSWPPMDPTSIGAMPTMERGADADPERLQFKSHEARNPVEERRKERERGEEAARRAGPTGPEVPHRDAAPLKVGEWTVVNGKEVMVEGIEGNQVKVRYGDGSRAELSKGMFGLKDAAPQPGEPGHEARELAVAHELEAMHNPASTFEDALFGGGRGHDYSRDATGLPQTVTHRQMQNFAAALNFGEGVTK